ncbi:uncharacterized protein LOC132941789 [Metopolophium dirhodum]|uniref:uncharacterized protein LOC132941789 n=1 Tax=Metopolophium dirhodum TaxID=44670 RepID=UPI00298F6915|nr:uncharacterized protein LOC132941789 [Metopolophium dirhodum]XP_060865944.1 uncharacterized protein LOC132941789 [Metopolophium dirhodum]
MAVWLEVLFVAFFISLPFLYDTLRTFRYHFRLAIFSVLASLTSLLAVFQFKHRSRLIAYFGQQISDLLSIEWCLYGKQNLSSTRARVAIINYQTDIDTLGLLHLVYCQNMELNIISETNFITLWPFSFFPWLISLALCPIQFFYTNLRLLNFSTAIIDSGPTILLASTIMTNEETIKMALKKKLPVQPIVFSNNYFINKEKHMFEPGRVIISVMPIIETDGLLANDIPNFSDEVNSKIRAEYDSISKITQLGDYQTPSF